VGTDRASQQRHYDGQRLRQASLVSAASFAAPESQTQVIEAKGLHFSKPPAPKAKPVKKKGFHWGRAAWEAVKGAGDVVKSVFTWKGAVFAVGAVALTIALPVSAWVLMGAGVALGAWEMGKAVHDGVKAHRTGDTEGAYKAARHFGGGLFTAGLSAYGLKHAPKNLRPHVPHGVAEWKAPVLTIDNLAVVGNNVLRAVSREEAAAGAVAAARAH